MNDDTMQFDSDIEAQLERLAATSPTPALPDALADLPWTVQRRRRRPSLRSARDYISSLGQTSLGVLRVAATLGLVLLFAYGAALVRTPSTGGPGNFVAASPSAPSVIPVAPTSPDREVVVIRADAEVDDSMVAYVKDGLRRAVADHAQALVFVLNTPGGTSDAMMSIKEALLGAQVPTVVWVAPEGARAASAGTFITLAAHFDLMAPATNIGAASPIDSTGQDIPGTLGVKVKEDAINQIKAIAQARHPKAVDWAASTVASAKSYTAQEAIDAGAVDGFASSLDDVLAFLNGKTAVVKTASGTSTQVTLATGNATIVEVAQDPLQIFLGLLRDPNIAFILLVIGVLAVLIELFHPTLLMGMGGVLALALSFYGTGSLPLNILGVVLVVLGIGMLVLEPSVPSHGLLTVGGLICFVVGAIFFYGSPGPYLPSVSVAWPIIITMTVVAAGYALILVRTLMSLRRGTATAGSGMVGTTQLVGSIGEVRRELDPLGTVYVAGEAWSARTVDGSEVSAGAQVRVVGQDGLTLVVEPSRDAAGA